MMQALLHRAATGRPLGVLKYAMTLDGKIATSSGHAAWVSCAESRARVFAVRARSDAVIVGGNTVRRDNPNLTTRREGGHKPVRIVMSRTLDLPSVSPCPACVLCGVHAVPASHAEHVPMCMLSLLACCASGRGACPVRACLLCWGAVEQGCTCHMHVARAAGLHAVVVAAANSPLCAPLIHPISQLIRSVGPVETVVATLPLPSDCS